MILCLIVGMGSLLWESFVHVCLYVYTGSSINVYSESKSYYSWENNLYKHYEKGYVYIYIALEIDVFQNKSRRRVYTYNR